MVVVSEASVEEKKIGCEKAVAQQTNRQVIVATKKKKTTTTMTLGEEKIEETKNSKELVVATMTMMTTTATTTLGEETIEEMPKSEKSTREKAYAEALVANYWKTSC